MRLARRYSQSISLLVMALIGVPPVVFVVVLIISTAFHYGILTSW